MKLNFPFKSGDRVVIYDDWENEKSPIGTAKLVSRERFGRSFILEEMMPETTQIVYNYEEGLVEWPEDPNPPLLTWLPGPVQSIQHIRYIDSIGIANSKEEDKEEEESKHPIVDSFITFNNKEIF